ncbi:cation transport protein-domain-containing protein [Tricladium varicosporioides]|nr:cation transport protein-domain-containing protein [Hymenoscyphus varicosporioides]
MRFRHFFVRQVKNRLSKPTFLTIHRAYFISMCVVCSVIFWLATRPDRSIRYIDSVFMVVSALTGTGLSTLNLSSLNTGQQILMFLLMFCGSPTLISVFVVWIRRRAFESKYAHVVQGKKARQRSTSNLQNSAHNNCSNTPASQPHPSNPGPALTVLPDHNLENEKPAATLNILFGQAIVGRNSQFYGLTRGERQQLGCIEYKALRLLSYLVPIYLVTFQVLGSIGLSCYIALNHPAIALENGVNPWWAGIFDGVSAFNNAGMSLLDASLAQFQTSYYMLLTITFLALVGNTAYPICLRLTLWTMVKLLPKSAKYREWGDIIKFILKYPRRVYTHLFPSTPTWYLLAVLFLFNGIDFVAFETLNRTNPAITSLSPIIRNLDGLVQTIMIRTTGFIVIPISSLRIGLQALYVPMMFISAFPVAITMRSSNVYEERSLGIYAHQIRQLTEGNNDNRSLLSNHSRTRIYFLRQQVQYQLSHDFWFVLVSAILIIWIETGSIDGDPLTFSVFNILFEVVSAYACVGLSIGLPNQAYSLCGAFHTSSKIILCVLMLRGRHRDLPVAIDRAIQLPDSLLADSDNDEQEQAQAQAIQKVTQEIRANEV